MKAAWKAALRNWEILVLEHNIYSTSLKDLVSQFLLFWLPSEILFTFDPKRCCYDSARGDKQVSAMAAVFQDRTKFSSRTRRSCQSMAWDKSDQTCLLPYRRASGCTCCSGWESIQQAMEQNLSIFNFFFFSLQVRLMESHYCSGWKRESVCVFLMSLYLSKFERWLGGNEVTVSSQVMAWILL